MRNNRKNQIDEVLICSKDNSYGLSRKLNMNSNDSINDNEIDNSNNIFLKKKHKNYKIFNSSSPNESFTYDNPIKIDFSERDDTIFNNDDFFTSKNYMND